MVWGHLRRNHHEGRIALLALVEDRTVGKQLPAEFASEPRGSRQRFARVQGATIFILERLAVRHLPCESNDEDTLFNQQVLPEIEGVQFFHSLVEQLASIRQRPKAGSLFVVICFSFA